MPPARPSAHAVIGLPLQSRTRIALKRPLATATGLLLFTACLLLGAPRAEAQNVQHTKNTVDEAFKSDLRVDPSTLGLNITIPFGGYAGRAGLNVPVGLRYSSKGLWTMEYGGYYHEGACCAPSFTANPQGLPSDNQYSYVSVSYDSSPSAGWESSFRPPSILDGMSVGIYSISGDPCDACELNERLYVQRLRVRMPDGSTHELRRGDSTYQHGTLPTGPGTYLSVDGSRLRYVETAEATGTLYLPDGSRFLLGNQPRHYVDRNGNRLTYNDASGTWTDTLGRTAGLVLTNNPPTPTSDRVYSLTGFGGAQRYFTFRYRYLADLLGQPAPTTGDMSVYGQGTYAGLFQSAGATRVTPPTQFNPIVLTEVELPDGRKYRFGYNEFGEVDKVVYPTGGYERFRHASVPGIDPVNEPYAQTNRGVVDRWVSPTGAAADELHTHYAVTAGAEYVVTTTNPDDTYAERRLHRGRGPEVIDFGFDDSRAGLAYDERVYSSAGQMLRRTLTQWGQSGPQPGGSPTATRDPRVTRVTELILDAGGVTALARTTVYDHDADLNVRLVTEHDFVGVSQSTAEGGAVTSIPLGTALRKTETTYLVNDPSVDAGTRAAYRARDLVSLPTSTLVRDAANAVVARTEVRYDEPQYYLPSYGPVTGWADPATLVRGNPTTVRSYAAAASPVAPAAACPAAVCVDTHAEYDLPGNVTALWDGNGHKTATAYSPAHAYAYPTSVTTPAPNPAAVPNPAGGYFGAGTFGSTTGFTSFADYDPYTGLVVSQTDANGKTTTYDYSDPLNRLKAVTRPDGGTTAYDYGRYNNAGRVSDYVATTTALDAGRSVVSYQYFDGLGRPDRSFLHEGGSPALFLTSDTQYDMMGRVRRVSNPHRTTGSDQPVNPPGLWTTTEYDALGRVRKVTTPDGARVQTEYDGLRVLVTDQADRQRISRTDGLGRLAEVWEVKAVDPQNPDPWLESVTFPARQGVPAVGTGYRTEYGYDVLGNLRTVTQPAAGAQAGQTRTFGYDSLSRLTSAANPESGTVAYDYDANGNLKTKTDARGVTANYTYDRLNRHLITHYSGGGTTTPAVYRHYDNPAAGKNGLGRFWWDYTGAGSGVTAASVKGYDAAGRILERRQSFVAGGAEYSVKMEYNLAGGVTKLTYPSGHTATYNYDAAGRLGDSGTQPSQLAFTGTLGDGVARTYAAGVQYSEFGGVRQERFGSQTPLYNKRHYNVRGQLMDVRLSTLSWDADRWSWDRGLVSNNYSTAEIAATTNAQRMQSGADNNGNVRVSAAFVPLDPNAAYTDGSGGSFAYFQERYTYDALNRLTSVTEFSQTPTLGFGQRFTQAYNYDRWGNRTIDAAATQVFGDNSGYAIPEPQYSVDPATNRLSVPAGKTGQMVYDSAGNLTLDTYQGDQGGGGTRAYDAENRMTGAVVDTYGNWAYYTYDSDGRRVKRKVADEEWWQVYGIGGELLAEYRAGAATFLPSKEYGYRGGELLVTMSSGDVDRLKRFVKNLYYNCLARDPSGAELTAQMNQLAQAGGQGGEPQLLSKARSIARGLFESAEYVNRGRTTQQYVTDLYNAYLQRGPDASGLAHWVGNTNQWGRGATLNAFEVSTEFATLSATVYGMAAGGEDQRVDTFVRNFYYGALQRGPTTTEAQAGRQRLNNAAAAGRDHVITEARAFGVELIQSTNYNAGHTVEQYVTDLYEAFLQRAPDGPGLNHWINNTNQYGRAATLDAFRLATEYGELAGTLHRETFWLVGDHLGTPRMVADRTGSLAGVKRHDYLPFGEELSAGAGGRATTQGYSQVDNVRQQFTGKERDGETGLDYFGARYYANAQGRFMSVDPIKLAGDRLLDPQRLNLYGYCRNTPLMYVDPDGEKLILANATARARARDNINNTLRSAAERGNIIIRGSRVLFSSRNQIANPSTAYTRLVNLIRSNEVHRYYGVALGQSAQATHPTAVDAATGRLLPQRQSFLHQNLVNSGGASLTYQNGNMDHFVPVSGNMTVEGVSAGSIIPFQEYRSWFHEILGHEPLPPNPSPAARNANNQTAVRVENQIASELGLPQRSGNDHDPDTYNVTESRGDTIPSEQVPLSTTITPRPLIPVPKPNP